ncbi:WD-40 repeat-containing protein [Marasmius fiardii PR-910]|nr:WD-40 repeat-containing protein [Marasmius fiardii PR-910]
MSTKIDTIYPADSVEFCPDPTSDIFACGTYKLLEGQASSVAGQRRVGQCLVYRWASDDSGITAHVHFLKVFSEKLQHVDLPAILDMKWSHRFSSNRPLLGIADSEGNISLHEWDRDESQIKKVSSTQVAPSSETLCLSLDWSDRRQKTAGSGNLVASLSNGDLCALDLTQSTAESSIRSWHAHDYEPWIAAWDYWNTNIVYSGGDDLKLKAWDLREDLTRPIFLNKRFDAGVTTIQCHPHLENLIAVGSYDSRVRLIDVRTPQMPLVEADVGGGAWRVKWHPSDARKSDLLVACMHDGFKVVHFDLDEGSVQVIKRYDHHESLAYGADWSFKSRENGESIVGSCSFYDHSLHLWIT